MPCRRRSSVCSASTSTRSTTCAGGWSSSWDESASTAWVQHAPAACSGGNLEELLAVLDPEVAGHAELGFAPHVDVEGRDNVAPRVLALFGPQTSSTLVSIPVNGEPGILALRNGRPFSLMVLRT